MALMDAISRPFGGEHTSRSCMLAAAAKGPTQIPQKVGSKQGAGRMEDERS